MRLTKVICTLGPASNDLVGALIDAGMDVARVNFSHGSPDERPAIIERIRSEAADRGKIAGILGDLSGPKVRLGEIEGGAMELRAGSEFRLGSRFTRGTPEGATTSHPNLAQDLRPEDRVLLADGIVELRVVECGDECVTEVVRGGTLRSRAGVNVPSHRLSLPAITERDARDVEQSLELGIELIAQSFVRRADDVADLRALVGDRTRIVAKIETRAAVEEIDRILEVANAIMIARGDLGVEIPFEEIPLVQEHLVRAAVSANKPVIVATQMLESMTQSARPTRAEVGDVATAVFQGADAIMLSAETAIGRFPIEAARAAARIARTTERGDNEHEPDLRAAKSDSEAVARAAAAMTHQMPDVVAIACFTGTGRAAELLAAARPRVPIYAFTPNPLVARALTIDRGVIPIHAHTPADTDEMLATMNIGLRTMVGLAPGSAVLMVAPTPFGHAETNLLKTHRVS